MDLEQENPDTLTGFTDKSFDGLPSLAIIGRSNTGKSTLFNRFMNRRMAIVADERGVTRDVLSATAFLMGKPVLISDTGGVVEGAMGLDKAVTDKALQTAAATDLVLLVLDASGITREDEIVIEKLRPLSNKLLVAVNKCEGGKDTLCAANFYQYGFSELFFISASHGDGVTDLAKAITARLDFSRTKEIKEAVKPIRIALMGKPNTGKSTLLNTLTRSSASIVSDIAGTTRDSVSATFTFKGRAFTVIDTAGIRKKSRVTDNTEYYSVNRAVKTLDKCDVVILMIDAKEFLSEQDKKICALAFESGRAIIFALNKWDLSDGYLPPAATNSPRALQNKPLNQTREFKKAANNINIMFSKMAYAPILPLIAKDGTGVATLLREVIEVYSQLNRKLDTSVLNKALKDFTTAHPAPLGRGEHFALRYITQTSVNPVEFTIFATRADAVSDQYIAYLQNKIRTELGFDKIPVRVVIKASRTAWENRKK